MEDERSCPSGNPTIERIVGGTRGILIEAILNGLSSSKRREGSLSHLTNEAVVAHSQRNARGIQTDIQYSTITCIRIQRKGL
jgi:hypothetical protein